MNIKRELKNSRIIMIKEFKQLFRKKVLFVPLFIFPIVMIVFFGYGMGGSVNNVGMLIVNNDMGVSSNALIQELGTFIPKNSDNKMFEITYTKDMAQSEAEDKINSGQYKAVLIIPADYSNSLAKNEKPEVILLTDQSDTTSSGIIKETMNRILSESQPVHLPCTTCQKALISQRIIIMYTEVRILMQPLSEAMNLNGDRPLR